MSALRLEPFSLGTHQHFRASQHSSTNVCDRKAKLLHETLLIHTLQPPRGHTDKLGYADRTLPRQLPAASSQPTLSTNSPNTLATLPHTSCVLHADPPFYRHEHPVSQVPSPPLDIFKVESMNLKAASAKVNNMFDGVSTSRKVKQKPGSGRFVPRNSLGRDRFKQSSPADSEAASSGRDYKQSAFTSPSSVTTRHLGSRASPAEDDRLTKRRRVSASEDWIGDFIDSKNNGRRIVPATSAAIRASLYPEPRLTDHEQSSSPPLGYTIINKHTSTVNRGELDHDDVPYMPTDELNAVCAAASPAIRPTFSEQEQDVDIICLSPTIEQTAAERPRRPPGHLQADIRPVRESLEDMQIDSPRSSPEREHIHSPTQQCGPLQPSSLARLDPPAANMKEPNGGSKYTMPDFGNNKSKGLTRASAMLKTTAPQVDTVPMIDSDDEIRGPVTHENVSLISTDGHADDNSLQRKRKRPATDTTDIRLPFTELYCNAAQVKDDGMFLIFEPTNHCWQIEVEPGHLMCIDRGVPIMFTEAHFHIKISYDAGLQSGKVILQGSADDCSDGYILLRFPFTSVMKRFLDFSIATFKVEPESSESVR